QDDRLAGGRRVHRRGQARRRGRDHDLGEVRRRTRGEGAVAAVFGGDGVTADRQRRGRVGGRGHAAAGGQRPGAQRRGAVGEGDVAGLRPGGRGTDGRREGDGLARGGRVHRRGEGRGRGHRRVHDLGQGRRGRAGVDAVARIGGGDVVA